LNRIKIWAKQFGPFILFSVWPFLSFVEHNKREITNYSEITVLALSSIACGFFLIGIFKAIFRKTEIQRIALVTGLGIATFFSFQIAVLIVQTFSGWWNIYYLVGWLIAFTSAVGFGIYAGKHKDLYKAVTFAGLVVVGIPLISVIWHSLQPRTTYQTTTLGGTQTAKSLNDSVAKPPNIYHFILDAYSRADVLKKYYNYDNSNFLDSLRRLNFQVIDKSFSNYPSTLYSLSTTLNMDYFLPSGPNTLSKIDQNSPIFNSVKGGDSVVSTRLRELGYTMFYANHKGSSDTNCEPNCIKGKSFLSALQFEILRMTPLYGILDQWYNHSIRNWGFFHQKSLEPVIDRLDTLRPDPIYLYAHILSPHSPFIYKRDCSERSEVDLQMTTNKIKQSASTSKQHYIDEIVCLNSRVSHAVQRIVNRDPGGIIIVQSDHGLYIPEGENLDEGRAALIRASNINFMRLPNNCSYKLPSLMSVINTFHVIFACLEQRPLKLISDRVFYVKDNGFAELPNLQ